MKLVIDSNNHHPITGAELKASGAVALIAKATEGTVYRDPTLGSQRTAAKQAGVPFGSYVFLHPDSKGSEAAFYLEYAQPRPGDLQPVVDAEVTNLGIEELARRTLTCAVALEAAGYNPGIYASSSIWKKLVVFQPKLKRFWVWEADYPGRFTRWFPRLAALRIALTRGVTVALWQWTDAFAVGSASFDASALLVGLSSITIPSSGTAALAGGGGGVRSL